jgi:hypothetical protein
MKSVAYILAAALAAGTVLSACSTLQVNAQLSPGANPAQYHTFGFAQPKQPSSQTAMFLSSPAAQEIRDDISRSLVAKGYQPVASGQPADFMVALHGQTQQKYDVEDWGYGGWYGWGGGGISVTPYTQGTIVVDFIDSTNNQVFWRGTASDVVQHPTNPDLTKVSNAMDQLMLKFPARVAAAPGGTPTM